MTWTIGKITLDYNPQEIKMRGKRDLKKLGIVAGKPLFMDMGLSGEEVGLLGWVLGDEKYITLREQGNNGFFQPVYVYNCPARYEGYYHQQEFGLTGKKGVVGAHEWTMKLWKVGTRANYSEGIYAVQDEITVVGLADCERTFSVIPLPVGAKHLLVDGVPSVSGNVFTRTGVDGNTECLKVTSTESIVRFDQDLSNMFKGECKVFDDMNQGSESQWVEVLDNEHVFTGRVVIQNNLVRIRQPSSGTDIDHYIWYSSAWNNVALHFNRNSPSAGPISFAFRRISREEVDVTVRWANGYWRRYRIRRGQNFFEFSDLFTTAQHDSTYELRMEWDNAGDKHQWVAYWDDDPDVDEENTFTGATNDVSVENMTDCWIALYRKANPWNGCFISTDRAASDCNVVETGSNYIDSMTVTWIAEPRVFIGFLRGSYLGTYPPILTAAGNDASVEFRAYEALHEHYFYRRLMKREWVI